MAQLQLSNVVQISVSQAQAGIGSYNTSNIGLFTRDAPNVETFGDGYYKIYLEPIEVGVDFGTDSETYLMALAIFSQSPNILTGSGYLAVIPFLTDETLQAAVARTQGIVQYFGVMATEITGLTDMLATAAVIQALNKIAFFVKRDPDTIEPGGELDQLTTGGFTQSRGLFYGSDDDSDALVMMASYAGKGLSVNFSGSNTTITMHLKDLTGVQPDPSMTQTLLEKAIDAGADTYVSLQGVPKVFCSGANDFYDQVYNLRWFVGALQVAGFNYLAESSTKIPQTEDGISGLKGAYRQVCQQAVSNQYSAPGTWTSAVTFGNQSDFLLNIGQVGYYIYSTPISQQSQADREARQAPIIQIALKEAGAVHSSTVIVYINA